MPAVLREIKKQKQTAREFIDERFENSLKKARKVVIVALLEDGNWEGYWQECKPSEIAYAALLLQGAALDIGDKLEVEEK